MYEERNEKKKKNEQTIDDHVCRNPQIWCVIE